LLSYCARCGIACVTGESKNFLDVQEVKAPLKCNFNSSARVLQFIELLTIGTKTLLRVDTVL